MSIQETEPVGALGAPAEAPSRRGLLLGGAAVATTAVAGPTLIAGAASAAATYPVNPYVKTTVPKRKALHMMNRMGCGFSRATFAELRAAGGTMPWVTAQLDPASVPENAKTNALYGWYPDLEDSPERMWERQVTDSKGGWEYAKDIANYSMLRRVYSNRQVLETMVDFWSAHLHVPASGDLCWVQRVGYDHLIRRHALGRFDEMLTEATLHPAMLLFLDNWRSVKNNPNENHGRELLELHTVGRTSGYTEQMVKDSAKILSGYTVDAFGTWEGWYDVGKHTTGAVQVLGFTAANTATDARQLTRDYLHYLAHHPATARTIARKLAMRFVSDNPSDALVDTLAQTFRDSGTDIKATLNALLTHPEFLASAGTRVRTPIEDFVATVRALQVDVQAPTNEDAFAHTGVWVIQSMLLYQWPRPDGPPNRDGAWSSPTRMLSAFHMHWNLAGGWWPDVDVVYKARASWLPQPRIRLDQYVDHLCRTIHGRRSTPELLGAVVAGLGYPPHAMVTKDHAVGSWLAVRLLGVLLDSPAHMSR